MNIDHNKALNALYDYAIDMLEHPEIIDRPEVKETVDQVARSILNYQPEVIDDLPFSLKVAVIDRSLEVTSIDQIQAYLDSDTCSAIINQDHHTDKLAGYFLKVSDDGKSAQIQENRLSSAQIQLVINKINRVEHLVFEGCRMMEVLPDLSRHGELHSVVIRDALNLKGISSLASLRELISLEIYNSMGITSFEVLAKNTHLRSLVAVRCGVESIQPLTTLEELTHLELTKCFHLTDYIDEDKPLLNALKEIKDLQVLKLSNISGLKNAAPLKELKELVELDISHTGIDDLSPLADLENLKVLTVDETQEVDALENKVEVITLDHK